jgi:hypothetical protein
MPSKDNFRVITIEIIAPNLDVDDTREALLEYIAEHGLGLFLLSSITRELDSTEWEEMQDEVSPELLSGQHYIDEDNEE